MMFFQINVLKFNVSASASEISILKTSYSAKISPDLEYLFFARDHSKIFRYSTLAQYTVLDLESKKLIELSPVSLII